MHKEIEKIKRLEGSPRVVKNLFSTDEINKFLDLFTKEIDKLKNELDHLQSGDEIKKFIYQERLSVLKKISQ